MGRYDHITMYNDSPIAAYYYATQPTCSQEERGHIVARISRAIREDSPDHGAAAAAYFIKNCAPTEAERRALTDSMLRAGRDSAFIACCAADIVAAGGCSHMEREMMIELIAATERGALAALRLMTTVATTMEERARFAHFANTERDTDRHSKPTTESELRDVTEGQMPVVRLGPGPGSCVDIGPAQIHAK